ncbi:hypothetical protein F4553_000642 [Allocatelliglobosispora scoriae]|uniref:PRC-barrel domain containing protein n=1 Tax=Allocatelliglobosispora scoriae TaxID=643052 RepID=A0A841BJQ7_9ACTN|nr:PRC-barrel domain containing protein [Allocatelliglobosispora scoriae]MBB5867263.1 hypothetical protein [Allocatelliglobosispora scoriae]
MNATAYDPWNYSQSLGYTADRADSASLVGYHVEATDGSIGKIDEASTEVGASYIVVDTGPWIFGSKVMLPAGVIASIDTAGEKVFVNRTKDEIKDAPEYDADLRDDSVYRDKVSTYYAGRAPR